MNKKIFILIGLAIIIFIGVFAVRSAGKESESESSLKTVVVIKEDRFEPENLEIKKGTTVVFKNEATDLRWPASNLHPTHGIYPEFDPKDPVKPEESWEFRFNKEGSWKYHDHLLPSITGVIVVK